MLNILFAGVESRFVIEPLNILFAGVESRCVIGPSNTLFAGVCVSTFQLGNRRFPEITGKDNLTVFSYSGRVKSPKWRRQLRRADLRQF